MLGGASIFLTVKSIHPDRKYWLNDLDLDVYSFWKTVRDHPKELVERLHALSEKRGGKRLFYAFKKAKKESDFERAVAFFYLNRCSFSGLTYNGGYSREAFKKRFTKNAIENILVLAPLLKGVQITNSSYEEMLNAPGKDVLLYLDPPYVATPGNWLYGRNGTFHKQFDHQSLASNLESCPHKWLLTYNDSLYVRKLFDYALTIKRFSFTYGMNNVGTNHQKIGTELYISNCSILLA